MFQSCMVLTFFDVSHLNVNFWNYTCNYSLTLLVEYFILTLKVTLIENETYKSAIDDWKRVHVYNSCNRLFNEAFKPTKFKLGLFYSCTVTTHRSLVYSYWLGSRTTAHIFIVLFIDNLCHIRIEQTGVFSHLNYQFGRVVTLTQTFTQINQSRWPSFDVLLSEHALVRYIYFDLF